MASQPTTVGRLLLKEVIPPEYHSYLERPLDKKTIRAMFQQIAKDRPDEYPKILKNVMDVAREFSTLHGKEVTFRLRDFQLPPELRAYRAQLQAQVNRIVQDPRLSSETKRRKVAEFLQSKTNEIHQKVLKTLLKYKNPFALMVQQGFRGSPAQLTQMVFGDILVYDQNGNPIPIPGLRSYAEGVTPEQYWAGSYGSRTGYAAVQFATAQTGYFGKRLALMNHNVRVTEDDCGDQEGVERDGSDPDIIGTVLARPIAGFKAGQVIDKNVFAKLRGKRVYIRSPLSCRSSEGVCRTCAGLNENGEFPKVGEYIGIDLARVTSEPLTQSGLSAKHTGGTRGGGSRELTGFEEVEQLFDVPAVFVGAAVLAPTDGKVENKRKAEQGGWYIKIGGQEVYIPVDRELVVKEGQEVEAGDPLTDGVPHPAEYARYKGLGEGRRKFAEILYDTLSRVGTSTHKHTIDLLSRSFLNYIRVNKPEGIAGYDVGAIVPYKDLENKYKPRQEAQERPVSLMIRNQYLEQPVLHYTVGTRVTPSVIKTLRKAGVKKVLVHPDPPGFEPYVVRSMEFAGLDPDWKVRLAGFNLRRTFMDAVTHGSSSPKSSGSYIPKLLDPVQLKG